MLVQAILIGLIAMFVTFEWMFGTNLGSRPIITEFPGVFLCQIQLDVSAKLYYSFSLLWKNSRRKWQYDNLSGTTA